MAVSACCQYCKYAKEKNGWWYCYNKNSGWYRDGRASGAWCMEFEDKDGVI